jgi:hypothetical protein
VTETGGSLVSVKKENPIGADGAIAAVVCGLPGLPAKPQTSIGIELNRERVAQIKRDETQPGGLPGRSESSEDTRPRSRAVRKLKPADETKDSKSKEKSRKDEKKDPQ